MDAAPLHGVGQAPGQERRLDHGAVRRERRAEHARGTDQSSRLVGIEPAHVVLAEAERAGLVDLVERPRPLGLAAHQVHRTTLDEVAVDPLARRTGADDVDRLLHGPAHRPHGIEAVPAGQRGVGGGEQRRAPAAVASRCPEPCHLPLQHGDAQRGVGQRQRVCRPQSGEPRADDADVDVEVLGERGARRQRDRDGLPPQGEPLIARCGSRRYSRRHASDSTSRSVEAMKSISSWPQMSGGDSCTTGSPRSSARQIKPASKSAPDK